MSFLPQAGTVELQQARLHATSSPPPRPPGWCDGLRVVVWLWAKGRLARAKAAQQVSSRVQVSNLAGVCMCVCSFCCSSHCCKLAALTIFPFYVLHSAAVWNIGLLFSTLIAGRLPSVSSSCMADFAPDPYITETLNPARDMQRGMMVLYTVDFPYGATDDDIGLIILRTAHMAHSCLTEHNMRNSGCIVFMANFPSQSDPNTWSPSAAKALAIQVMDRGWAGLRWLPHEWQVDTVWCLGENPRSLPVPMPADILDTFVDLTTSPERLACRRGGEGGAVSMRSVAMETKTDSLQLFRELYPEFKRVA